MHIDRFPSRLLENAVNEFAKLPGIGRKSALRLVLHMLKTRPSGSRNIWKQPDPTSHRNQTLQSLPQHFEIPTFAASAPTLREIHPLFAWSKISKM